GADALDPGLGPPRGRAWRDLRRRPSPSSGDLLRHDRLRDRAHLRPPPAREVVLGMAHRGRLNVLAHTVGRPYQTVLVEFEGEQNLEADTAMPEGGTGDVKYHHGASGNRKLQGGNGISVTLSPNPSHL